MKKIKKISLIILFSLISSGYYDYTLDSTVNAITHSNDGIFYMNLREYDAAITSFKIAIALNPDSPASATYYYNLGVAYMKLNIPTYALEAFELAIKKNPAFFEYYAALVDCYAALGQLEPKLNYYKSLIQKDSMNSYAWLFTALINEKMGNTEKAIENYKLFLVIESDLILKDTIKNKLKEYAKEEEI